ncbi:MAG: VanZ family protein [Gammaproteobacteria bacterium]
MNRSLYLNRWLNSFYILFLISLYLFFAPFEDDGPEIFQHLDKITHFSIFFLMTVLLIVGRLKKDYALIFCILYALFTEIVQTFLNYRTGSILDFVSDILGITFAIFFIFFLEKRAKEHK